MKKIIVMLTMIAVLCTSCFVLPATTYDCNAATKYVKVKQADYKKMKKTIKTQKEKIAKKDKAIAKYKLTIAEQKLDIAEANATIKDKKATISWLWSSLEGFGYTYSYTTHKWELTPEDEEEEQ